MWFNYLDNRTKFWLTSSFNVGGFLLTLFFMPDPLRVSLTEVRPAAVRNPARWQRATFACTRHLS